MSKKTPDYILTYGLFYEFGPEELDILYELGYPRELEQKFFKLEKHHMFVIREPNNIFIIAVCVDKKDIELLENYNNDYIPLDLNPRNVQNNEGLAEYILNRFGHCSHIYQKSNRLWTQLGWPIEDDQPDFIIFQKNDLFTEFTSRRIKSSFCSII